MKHNTAIIVPVYNEEKNLQILIPKIYKNVKNANVIIVDDNSKDKTKALLTQFKKKHKTLIHLRRKTKLGRGTAVIHGFEYALRNAHINTFVEMDADLSHDPDELPQLLRLSNHNTVVIASRYLKKSRIVGSPLQRKVLSKIANKMNSMLFSLPIHDNSNGYRIYPRNAIELLTKHRYVSTGFVSISESTYLLFKKGFKLKEQPTVFVNRRLGDSKADLHEIYISIRDLLKIRFNGS